MTSRKFAARWSWLTLIGIVLLGMAPGANRSLRGQEAAKGLALVPSNALALLHLRPADLWNGPVGSEIRRQFPEHMTNLQRAASMSLGSEPAAVESVTFIFWKMESLDSRRRPNRFDEKKGDKAPPKDFEDKKFEDKKEPLEKKQSAGFGDKKEPFEDKVKKGVGEPPRPEDDLGFGPDMILVTTAKEFDPEEVLELIVGKKLERAAHKHKGKTYYVAAKNAPPRRLANPAAAVFLVDGHTYLITSTAGRMKKVLDVGGERKDGPLSAALKLAAKKHTIVAGLNLTEPSGQAWATSLKLRAFNPFEPPSIHALLPVLEMQEAVLTVDLGKAGRAGCTLVFADQKRARAAVDAVKDGLVLLRLFGLGTYKIGLHRAFEEEVNPKDLQSALFLLGLVELAGKALREAQVETQGAAIHVQAQVQFDLKAAKEKAEKDVMALLKDEKFILAKRQRISSNNLKQMLLALHGYHDTYRFLPPAAVCSKENGKPLLSWRVLILPFIEEDNLYRQFKLDEPWDSPNNIKLLPRMPKIYAPIGKKTKEPYTTFYQAFVGPGAAMESRLDKNSFLGAKGTSLPRDFLDGTSNTIGIVEAAEPVPWSKPADLPYDDKKPLPKVGGLFSGGFHAAFMDGSVRFLPSKINERTLRALITRAGGEVIDWDQLDRPGGR